jgi:hypothetical protein
LYLLLSEKLPQQTFPSVPQTEKGEETELEAAVQQLLEQRDITYEQWLSKVDNYCAAITNRQP